MLARIADIAKCADIHNPKNGVTHDIENASKLNERALLKHLPNTETKKQDLNDKQNINYDFHL